MLRHWSDRFFGPLYVQFDELKSEAISKDISGMIRSCNVESNTKVVELCCGYGRLLIPLAAKTGARATGIDKSPALLKIAEESAREQGVSISWKKANLMNYIGNRTFDVAFIAGTSFGYYDDIERNQRVMQAARSCLKRGGIFLLAQWNWPRVFHGRKEDGEFVYERKTKFNPALNVYSGSYSYRNKITKQKFIYPFRVILYRYDQLEKMFANAGFGHIRFYGDFDGRPFDEKGERLVAVCKAI